MFKKVLALKVLQELPSWQLCIRDIWKAKLGT